MRRLLGDGSIPVTWCWLFSESSTSTDSAVLPAYHDAMSSFDEEAYIKQPRISPIPSDEITARQWLAGYTTKVAVIAAVERNGQSASLLLGIGGSIMLTVALICTISLISRWNNGERDILMVRLIRHYVQK